MPRVIAFERLDLDDLGTEIGEHQPAARPHDDVHEFNNADALQGQSFFSHLDSQSDQATEDTENTEIQKRNAANALRPS